MLVLDGGDLFWKTARMSDKRLRQQRRKGALQLDVLTTSGIHAMVPGKGDLALGVDWLTERAKATGAPYTAANLMCDGAAPFPPSQTATVAGLDIRVVGLLSDEALMPRGCVVAPAGPALARALEDAPDADLVVVLSRLSLDDDIALAEAEPRIDLIVGGGSQTARPTPKLLGHNTARIELGTRGKKLGVTTVHWEPGATGFAVQGSVEELEKQLDRLKKRRASAADHLERTDDERSKERQQRRLDHYDKEIPRVEAELAAARSESSGPMHGIDFELQSLGPGVADHPATAEKVAQALADIEAMEAAAKSSGPLRGPFMGSGSCAGCHPAQTQQWKDTPHAKAWRTLVDQKRHVDLDCYGCHATGAFHPEGPAHPNQVGQLKGVGCESCHGPGRDHVRDPKTARMEVDPPEATCIQCHDGEQDEGRFDFESYRPKIVHTGVVSGAPTE